MANSYTLAGTAKARGLSKVDPRLVQIIAAAAARSPYQVQIFSGKRAGAASGSRHNSGNALDIALIDPNTGQVIPNYKSSTGFPIYAEFAKVAREEQMRLAPDMADQFRWGGGFSDKDFDLMHFDFKPGGAMAYWTWQDGGKLTAAGAKAVPKFGAGWIYANGERYKARSGQYASLWGREPLQAPQTAQSAIADLVNPGGGTQVPEPPTAAMGFAPTLPDLASFEPPPSAGQAPPMPMPQMPPQWAQAGGFPIDEALTGQSAQDVLMGGPRPSPNRPPMPASGPVGPTTAQGVLDMGPRPRPDTFEWRGGGAPDPGAVPSPNMSPRAQAEMAQFGAAMTPRMRPDTFEWRGGGAPDAGSVPDPRMRAAPYASTFPPRPEAPAAGMPPASRSGDLSAAMGGPPAPSSAAAAPSPQGLPDLPPLDDELYSPGNQLGRNRFDNYRHRLETRQAIDDFGGAMESRDLASDLGDTRQLMERELTALPGTGVGADPSAYPPEAFTGMPSLTDRISDAAGPRSSAWQVAGLPDINGASFPTPPPVAGTVEAGSTGGEFFTPAPPMPRAPPDLMSQRFDDAFAPAAPGMIADLPGAFANRQASPPTVTAQDGINSVFGAPPAQATPPNLAIPFAEVPGFGVPPASAATIASPLPSPAMPAPQPISMEAFNDRFGGGSVVRPPTPVPGQPGVVSGEMPTPAGAMDIRSPAQGGPAFNQAPALPAPPPQPRQTNPGQGKGALGRVLGGILGGAVLGPIGGLAGGLLGGALRGGGGGFGFGGQPSFAWSGGGNAPYGNNGGSTTYKTGTSNALGGSNALSWQGSGGQQVTVVQDPWTGTYYGPTTTGGGLY